MLLYFDLAFVFSMQVKGLASVTPKITKLKNDIAAIKKEFANMEKIKKEEGPGEEDASLKSKKIVLADEMPALLERISKVANVNNVRIMQINSFKEEVPKGKTKKPAKPKGKAEKKDKVSLEENFSPYLITMELLSGFHNLGSFLAGMDASLDTVVSLVEVSVSADPQDYLHQEVSLVLRTYVKK